LTHKVDFSILLLRKSNVLSLFLAERAEKKIGWIPEERYRILWDNLPVRFKIRRLEKFFGERKCTLETITCANSWGGFSN